MKSNENKHNMERQHHIRLAMKRIRQYLLLILFTLLPVCAAADNAFGFTKDKPLIIAADWDFQPFEFLNSEGRPSGYNIDVLNLIFDRLDIPHKFVMQEWYVALQMFERREADLIHALSINHTEAHYAMTKNYISYYNLRAARKSGTPPLTGIDQLGAGDTIILKKNDYAALRIHQDQDSKYTVEYRTPKDGLTGIAKGNGNYYIWGEIPLTRKVKELNLDSIVLDIIDIPAGELHIIGYNKKLVDTIDDEFARLEQSGELAKIHDKWFHPERVHNDTSPLALLIILGTIIIGVIGFLLTRLITVRVKNTVNRLTDLNNMQMKALSMGDYCVVEWDIEANMLHNQYGHTLPDEGMQPEEFLKHLGPGQAETLHNNNILLLNGQADHFDLRVNLNLGTQEQPRWKTFQGNAVAERFKGKTVFVIYTAKDITREVEEERINQELGKKYMKVFDTNIIPMSFYNSDGYLIDLNQKMRELCEFESEQHENYFRSIRLFDVPGFKDILKPGFREEFHSCMQMQLADIGLTKYVENRITPAFDDQGRLVYYVVSGRDITDERNSYIKQRRHDQELKKTNETIKDYETQLRYLLERCDMYVWEIDLATLRIQFSRQLSKIDYEQPRADYMAGMVEEEREDADRTFKEQMMQGKEFHAIHHFDYTIISPQPCWYSLSGVPKFDAEGRPTSYFGIARNITDLMEAQQKLREEKLRAENSGRMKAAFLANMTHEIRTPLNAIVGFSDILQMVESTEERMEFIRIIRNNCDMLLRLINDILEASNMGQALSIEPESCDFAQVFNDICQTLEQRVAEAGVPFIKDNPYPTYQAVLDKGRVQQVLTNFTTNAVKYTKTGHIKVGYREEQRSMSGRQLRGIYFYCEDTGAGIPKDKQSAVFERFVKLNDFVQGTGLGLSICKSIAEKCGGSIGVSSEGEGHGSTFWMWIPQE